MDNKTPDEKNKEQKKTSLWKLLSPYVSAEDTAKMTVYYGGCMGAIVFLTLLIRWLVGIFK